MRPRPSCSPTQASQLTSSRSSLSPARSDPGSRCKATRCGSWPSLASGTRCAPPGTPSTASACAPPTATGPCSPTFPTPGPADPISPPRWACHGPTSRASCSAARPRRARNCASAPRSPRWSKIPAASISPSLMDRLDAMTCSSAPTASAPGRAARWVSSWRPARSAWGSGARSAPARPASSALTCITAPLLYRRVLPDG